MKVFVYDHTLHIQYGDAIYGIRPCLSWDGKASFKNHIFPWFKLYSFDVSKSIWKTFAIPYLLVFKVKLKEIEID